MNLIQDQLGENFNEQFMEKQLDEDELKQSLLKNNEVEFDNVSQKNKQIQQILKFKDGTQTDKVQLVIDEEIHFRDLNYEEINRGSVLPLKKYIDDYQDIKSIKFQNLQINYVDQLLIFMNSILNLRKYEKKQDQLPFCCCCTKSGCTNFFNFCGYNKQKTITFSGFGAGKLTFKNCVLNNNSFILLILLNRTKLNNQVQKEKNQKGSYDQIKVEKQQIKYNQDIFDNDKEDQNQDNNQNEQEKNQKGDQKQLLKSQEVTINMEKQTKIKVFKNQSDKNQQEQQQQMGDDDNNNNFSVEKQDQLQDDNSQKQELTKTELGKKNSSFDSFNIKNKFPGQQTIELENLNREETQIFINKKLNKLQKEEKQEQLYSIIEIYPAMYYLRLIRSEKNFFKYAQLVQNSSIWVVIDCFNHFLGILVFSVIGWVTFAFYYYRAIE
ncbi:hypothetical protein PPERSA_11486 [Pseudocohnilembus persalinus]|uniref:Transmembrane protein n=1 Tax=Pseudocohnilembus persalinus TaxID=266149 RepID=A0A0V0QWR4_PSEPJ|nr:hypothetical protein PPERSA_11486 [Pseudocohnilembus persalinus]|eukprot:KRX06841.1 hypothetical protein PPERSA_11486 [Pseudocohnilembus persalinus]